MNIGTGVSPFAKRLKEKQGWLAAGAISTAILSGFSSHAQSMFARVGFALAAAVVCTIAVWLFVRGPLKHS
jgi:hypothetical protein